MPPGRLVMAAAMDEQIEVHVPGHERALRPGRMGRSLRHGEGAASLGRSLLLF
jgi:hypothetical protein